MYAVYIDVGMDFDSTRSVNLGFTFATTLANGNANNRRWEICVSQIEYSSHLNPPNGCLQYHWGHTGQFETFNFAGGSQHLINQHYSVCFREELGMCCLTLQTCSHEGSFTTTNINSLTGTSYYANNFGCFEDWISIEDFQTSTTEDGPESEARLCGALQTDSGDVINGQTCTTPFKVNVHFDNAPDIQTTDSITRNSKDKAAVKAAPKPSFDRNSFLQLKEELESKQNKAEPVRTARQLSGVQSRGVCMVYQQEYCGGMNTLLQKWARVRFDVWGKF